MQTILASRQQFLILLRRSQLELYKTSTLAQRSWEDWASHASHWLKDCLDHHEICLPQTLTRISPPSRVVDVGPPDGSQVPFLSNSSEDVREWVTLSHCWGQHQPLKTTLQSLSEFQRALPMHTLPPLFRDAVSITRTFSYRYLWIDSLCIIQDSKEDWAREISNMGNIYKHCIFTIAAETSRDSREAIIGNHIPIETEYVHQPCRSSAGNFQGFMYTFDNSKWQALQPHSSFLEKRAWALQEHVLSPRTLAWDPLQVAWSCRSGNTSGTSIVPVEFGHSPEPRYRDQSQEHFAAFRKCLNCSAP